jgi:hypothetical protein
MPPLSFGFSESLLSGLVAGKGSSAPARPQEGGRSTELPFRSNPSDALGLGLSIIRTDLAAISCIKKSIFNLSGNTLKPIFRSESALLKISKLSLQLVYAIFGRSKLYRKAMSDAQSSATIVFSGGGRLLDQSHNGLTGAIHWVPILWNIVSQSWRKRNDILR